MILLTSPGGQIYCKHTAEVMLCGREDVRTVRAAGHVSNNSSEALWSFCFLLLCFLSEGLGHSDPPLCDNQHCNNGAARGAGGGGTVCPPFTQTSLQLVNRYDSTRPQREGRGNRGRSAVCPSLSASVL